MKNSKKTSKKANKPYKPYRSNKPIIISFVLVLFALVIFGVLFYIKETYTVKTVYVDGSTHYTDEEIMNVVMSGRLGNNSLYLALKYKTKGVEDVPFVETMDVEIMAPDTIRISVYEKALAGYVEYLGRYMYFDKDGIIVESSTEKTAGIPQVTGLTFDHVVLYEELEVENSSIFSKVLDITQLLEKYTMNAEKIHFDEKFEITLIFGNVKVAIGTVDNIDEKFMKLKEILPKLDGKSGTLYLQNYTEETLSVTFVETNG